MTTRFVSIIREWLGWCPHAHARVRNAETMLDDEAVVPLAGGSFKNQTIHWIGLFRNQTLLQIIGTFFMGLYLFAGLGGWSNLNPFIIGILAGLPFSAVVGIWYWRIFNEVLCCGPVVLWNRYDKISGTFTIVAVAVSVCVWALVLSGTIPGVDLAMTSAFFGGFIAVLFWGVFIGIWKWETDMHHRLHFDGMMLELEKENYLCDSLKQ